MQNARITVYGDCDKKFAGVKKAFAENFHRNREIGASFAVTLNGETVVDLWAGFEDKEKTRPWTENTLVCVFSSTKVPTALCLHMLVDEGKVDLEAPVAQYWPEFGQRGKSSILVKHLLSHSAALPGFDQRMSTDTLYDWNKTVGILSAQSPRWTPGTKSGYHSITYGYLVGELVRRISGVSIGTFFRERIGQPLDMDFYYGLPAEHRNRVADLYFPREYPFASVPYPFISIAEKVLRHTPDVFLNPLIKAKDTRTKGFMDAEIPGSNGYGNARSLAQTGAILAGGGTWKGQSFISKDTLQKAMTPQYAGRDAVLRVPLQWGLGFALQRVPSYAGRSGSLFWGGYGGSFLSADVENNLSMGYAMNKGAINFMGDKRTVLLSKAVYDALRR